MKSRPSHFKSFLCVQVLVVAAFVLAFVLTDVQAKMHLQKEFLGKEPFTPVPIAIQQPLRIKPLYDRPDIVSDEDLAAVLNQILPRFENEHMKPNHIEHSLRTWGIHATFQNPEAVSGMTMLKFLTDHASYMESWGNEMKPLLEERPTGIAIRWGAEDGASYHHDHWLACVTEAGATLDTPIYGPSGRDMTLQNVLQESLRDFRLDEKETEWTAMGFGLWIAPTAKAWVGSEGRKFSFDLLAQRLMRGQKQLGVCSGTHRVYSLMMLIRLDDEYDILSDSIRGAVYRDLEQVRDMITASQFEDGHWTENWPDGKNAVENPIETELYKSVIATGHHLEWLSIAPPELHPPDAQILKAAKWIIQVTKDQTPEEIKQRYTFFSHVGAALANWRQVHPADFWHKWETEHPYQPETAAAE